MTNEEMMNNIIELNYKLTRNECILELLINRDKNLIDLISSKLNEIDEFSFKKTQAKFPGLGIKIEKKE